MSADLPELRQRMVDELATNDYVIPHWQAFLPWRSAFLAVPRHELIPDTVWVKNGAGLVPLRRTDDPPRWLDLTYADLCRVRHKSAYAEHRIMPTGLVKVLVSRVEPVGRSA